MNLNREKKNGYPYEDFPAKAQSRRLHDPGEVQNHRKA
jgi:hypothetical protein